VSNFIECR